MDSSVNLPRCSKGGTPPLDLGNWFHYRRLYDLAVERIASLRGSEGGTLPSVVELGAWKGSSVIHMARLLVDWFGQSGFALYAVDTWNMDLVSGVGNTLLMHELEGMLARGESLHETYLANVSASGLRDQILDTRMDSAQAADLIPGPVDFVFIDADHREEAVVRDIEAWRGKARILAGHDISEPGVVRAVRRCFGCDWYEMPVVDSWTTDKELADAVNGSANGLYLGIPLGGDGGVSGGTQTAVVNAMSAPFDVNLSQKGGSLLPFNFNALLCEALNCRKSHGLVWFVMLHSDIAPLKPDWLTRLIEEFEATGVDVLSAISPIKSGFGLTSTALDTHPWRPQRLTMAEVMDAPETFDCDYARQRWGADLLINTGLMVFRLDNEWCERICFDIVCRNWRDEKGVFQCDVEPEDWRFSRWCNARGLKVATTRKVELLHKGPNDFNNFGTWGMWKTDEGNLRYKGGVSPLEPRADVEIDRGVLVGAS